MVIFVWKLSDVDVCSPCWGIGHPFEFIFFKNFFELFSLYILPLFYKGISTLHPVKSHTFVLDFVVFPFIKLRLVWNSLNPSSLYMGNHKINLRFRESFTSYRFLPFFCHCIYRDCFNNFLYKLLGIRWFFYL